MQHVLKKCFRPCKVEWKLVNSSRALRDALLLKTTDFALPIVPFIEHELEDGELVQDIENDFNSGGNNSLDFKNIVSSPGLSFIVHTSNFNNRAKKHIIVALLQVWPIVVFLIILAGMSGIFVWALVSRIAIFFCS